MNIIQKTNNNNIYIYNFNIYRSMLYSNYITKSYYITTILHECVSTPLA